ncbi:tetratricopeptide (TPR) repeat protein [Rhodobium orientis]|uniref:tetratricopeptide repeat protein n=1 Tax=Rhodobium orientis TaxID=34017 RepID=UPI000DAC0173|nr:tetratricopeptide repeat protein [Rhodobium orientis]MBB4301132.1 tetratricopeptide (TPR) repeat protein [Rhodobium orientis]
MTARFGLLAAAALAAGLAMIVLGAPARAADGGGPAGPSSCGPGMTWDPVSRICIKAKGACKRGTVRDRKTGKCVAVKAFNGDSETRYQVARFYAYDGRFEDAIALLDPIAYERDPRVLNMLGYSNRKLGHFDTGLAYYRRALAIDPSFDLAREYLGEGYVALGRIDLAREQLGHIARSCGTGCEEYRALDTVIKGALAAKG